MAHELFLIVASTAFWEAVLRIGTPLILGTLGVLWCERAGVLNLGIEGIMVAGAFVGWFTVHGGASLWWGAVAAMAVGMAIGLVHAGLTVVLGLSQHVAGLGLTLLATSLSSYVYRLYFAANSTPPIINTFQPMRWLPVPVLSGQTALTLCALAAVPAAAFILYRTPVGLAIRAVGDNPGAADGQGIRVIAVRTGAVMAGSAMMALAGAFLTLSAFNAFYFNMVNGRGWICVALVVFASWRPGKVLLGALLFATFDALQLRLQQLPGGGLFGGGLPYQFYLMLPYLLSIAALVVGGRHADYPRALMKPFRRGER